MHEYFVGRTLLFVLLRIEERIPIARRGAGEGLDMLTEMRVIFDYNVSLQNYITAD